MGAPLFIYLSSLCLQARPFRLYRLMAASSGPPMVLAKVFEPIADWLSHLWYEKSENRNTGFRNTSDGELVQISSRHTPNEEEFANQFEVGLLRPSRDNHEGQFSPKGNRYAAC